MFDIQFSLRFSLFCATNMTRSSKNTISLHIFLIMITIVCVSCAPKSRWFLGQSSNSGEESLPLKYCKLELFAAFKMKTGLENFLHAFLNLTEENFVGITAFTPTTRSYYFDLIYRIQDIGLPELINPHDFCHENRQRYNVYNCTSEIASVGCPANVAGKFCLEHLYLHWKKLTPSNSSPEPETEDITDENLYRAISQGITKFSGLSQEELLENLSDDKLLEDFYRRNSARRGYAEDLLYVYELSRDANSTTLERDFKRYKRQKKIDTYDARYVMYGISEVSYAVLNKEYNRRQNMIKYMAIDYAMTLHDAIKNWRGGKFRTRQEYCEWHLQQTEGQSSP